jgi:radical SAM-linked protein
MAVLKIRLAYTKKNEAKYIAHLDLTRVFDRALRRAHINVHYSQGFNPHPKISFGPPLAVGVEGEREYVDIDVQEVEGLSRKDLLAKIVEKLQAQLPEGISITDSAIRPEGSKALMAVINLARYKLIFPEALKLEGEEVAKACERWLARDEVRVVRWHKGKESERNIRSMVNSIEILSAGNQGIVLRLDIVTGNKGSVRPAEVLASIASLEGLDIDQDEMKVIREGLYVADANGQLNDPLKEKS